MIDSPTQNEKQTPRDLLPAFYKQYQLDDDGGQSSPYVRIEVTRKIFLYMPNFEVRRKAIFKHDVHHIVTGYTSTFKGETEIGAWEVASGCGHYWIAFVLDLSAMMSGMLFNPGGVYRAFVKGRRTKNLYRNLIPDEQIMDMPVGELKRILLLDNYPEKNFGNPADFFLFIPLLLFGIVYYVLSLLLVPVILGYTGYVILKNKKKGMA